MSKSIVRGVKNMTKGYSSVQVKVRNGKQSLTSKTRNRVLIGSTSHQQRLVGSQWYGDE